jgi:hypothetical protein
LLHGDGVEQTLGSVLRELAHEQFCRKLRELTEQILRASKLVRHPDLVDKLVAAQAEIEGREVPPVRTSAHNGLRRRAIRAYVLEAQLTEIEQQSGAADGLATIEAGARAGQRSVGLSDLISEQIKANGQLEQPEAER